MLFSFMSYLFYLISNWLFFLLHLLSISHEWTNLLLHLVSFLFAVFHFSSLSTSISFILFFYWILITFILNITIIISEFKYIHYGLWARPIVMGNQIWPMKHSFLVFCSAKLRKQEVNAIKTGIIKWTIGKLQLVIWKEKMKIEKSTIEYYSKWYRKII